MFKPFQSYNFKFTVKNEKLYIYDEVRRKYVLCTPEEKVRQWCVHHLIYDLGYSRNLIQIEKGFLIQGKTKRIDIAVFDTDGNPYILVECKAPEKNLNASVLAQLAQYNSKYNACIFLLTNGVSFSCFTVKDGAFISLETIPSKNNLS